MNKKLLSILLVVVILVFSNIVVYKATNKHVDDLESLYFKNDQVSVLFKSELQACNLKWKDTCGIGIVRGNAGGVYYVIEPKDMIDKGINTYYTPQ